MENFSIGLSADIGRVNYRDPFKVAVRILDAKGDPCLEPWYDFRITLISGDSRFEATRIDGVMTHCHVSPDDPDEIIVDATDHGLYPCPLLTIRVSVTFPDADSPDGFRSVTRTLTPGIALVCDQESLPTAVEIEAIMPVIKGEKGDRGDIMDFESLTESEIADLRVRLGIEPVVELTPEEIADIAEQEYRAYMNLLN
ncbi:MAG: hypothetical protein K2H86_09055 [Muribaculaceae bacterium]|nr:hypothetical protein [Muribaculaceae bacterium]